MIKIFFTTILFSAFFSAKAQLLWELSGNGAKKSYIFGTNHLALSDFLDSVPNVFKAYNSCQVVVGEVLMSAKNISDTIMAHASMPKGKTLKELFTEAEFAEVDRAVQKTLFFSLKDVAALKPAMISAMYAQAVYESVFKKKEDDFQLDSYFQQIAEMQDKKVFALESTAEQSALLFGNQPLERQKVLLLETVRDSAKLAADIKKIVNLYQSGNLDLLYAEYINDTGKTAPTLKEIHDLLYNRNEKWVKKIAKIISKNSAFIAVGALHLPSENGFLNLLKKAGYKVKAVL